MGYIDPLKVMRNPETLAAYRRYQRESRAKGLPWLLIGAVAGIGEGGVGIYAVLHNDLGHRVLHLVYAVLMMVSAVAFAIAAVRMWLFERSHPFELP